MSAMTAVAQPSRRAAFQTGPYGEILPPPLTGGLDPDEAIAQMVEASKRMGHPIKTVPRRGESGRGMANLAMLYAHQFNLAGAIAGRLNDDPDALALRRAVVERRQPMSLRPLGMEGLWFSSFAPVLQLVDPDEATWRVGLPDKGRTMVFHARSDQAVRQAQKVYVQWSGQDSEQWQAWLGQAAREVKPHYQHIIWQAALTTTPDLTAHLASGFALQRLGKHSTYRIITPEGERVFEASNPKRAVRMASAILRKNKVNLPHYLPGQVVGALVRMGSQRPVSEGAAWRVGRLKAKFVNRQVIGLSDGKARYGLTQQGNVFRVGVIGNDSRVMKTLGSLVVPAVWTKEEKTRVGLTWAARIIGGKK